MSDEQSAKRRKSIAPELIAAALAHADLHSSDAVAAKHFGVSERSIKRWRAQVLAGKLPDVAQAVRQKKAEVLAAHSETLDRVFVKFLLAIERRVDDPNADNTLRQLIGGVKVTGELRIQRDLLKDDDGKPPGVRAARTGDEAAADADPSGARGTSRGAAGSGDADTSGGATKAPVH